MPTVVISKDLGSAAHIDPGDEGHCCTVWFEKETGSAQNWYLLFPHVLVWHDEKEYDGLVIQLFHGCLVSWEGAKLRHCSSVVNPGNDNHVFGIFFAMKNYVGKMIDDEFGDFLVKKK